jgi:hypothetical protein
MIIIPDFPAQIKTPLEMHTRMHGSLPGYTVPSPNTVRSHGGPAGLGWGNSFTLGKQREPHTVAT